MSRRLWRFLLLAACAVPFQAGAAGEWVPVVEERFDTTASLSRWEVIQGEWSLTTDGLRRHGRDAQAVIQLRQPVAAGAVRVEFEAKSDEPGDLSLILGTERGTLANALFCGFGSRGNTASVLSVSKQELASAKDGVLVPGHWHRLAVTREGGRATLEVDGRRILDAPEPAAGLAGAQIAFYFWNSGVVRSVRVLQRAPAATASRQDASDGAGWAVTPVVLYVSPRGNDAWSGGHADPMPDVSDGPLATIEAARDRLRAIKKERGLAGGATVWLRGGVYALGAPLVFKSEDSGAVYYADGSLRRGVDRWGLPHTTLFYLDAPVRYAAYPGEVPVISGGRRLSGWRTETVNGRTAWVTELPDVKAGDWEFRQLFVNNQRRVRPRLPKTGFYWMEDVPGLSLPALWGASSQDAFICREGDVQAWRNLADAEVVALHYWIEERFPLAAFDAATRRVELGRISRAPLSDDFHDRFAKYHVDNVFEALTEPGEWYLDRPAGVLYYLPLPGEHPERTVVVAPRLLQLVVMDGDPEGGSFVDNVHFEGIEFRNTDWRHPGEDGTPAPRKAAHPLGSEPRGRYAAAGQAANDVSGIVSLYGARGCVLEDCRIANGGWYGVDLGPGCVENRIVGCELTDLGAGGVRINGADISDPAVLRTGGNRITDNHIHACGRVFHSAVGVLSMLADRNVISHNHIHDLYYTGISVGWRWGYAESLVRDNIVEKNHIHDIGQGWLSDMGGIYTLGVQPGTVLRGNVIHDIVKSSYGGWAIYLDEGSSHIIVENNICYRASENLFNLHYGRENIVRNNIFALGGDGLVSYARIEENMGFTLERNILATAGKPLFLAAFGPGARRIVSDLNVFWDVSGQEPIADYTGFYRPSGDTLGLAVWRALGHDRHSVVADPKFRDLAAFDFALAPDSPALALGFRPIDTSDVGPRPRTGKKEEP
ncbi:MAG: right-handed parallel beta-helix repeat-containing protein [Lentisphaerae bacterium]|nr:right-handed parallel beta-helix repeat-containing protein [Lentisphaerota bacterium]